MNNRSFDRLVIIIIGSLVLVLAGVVLLGNLAGARPPEAQYPASGSVGMRGPFILQFPQNMQRASVEALFETQPAIDGRYGWDGRTLFFWPDKPLIAGQQYAVRLREGAVTEDGRIIRRGMEALYTVRQPEVVFMSPVTGNAEIWISSIDPAVMRPITSTGGSVYDYGVTADGEHIIYSARNQMTGLDLWMIDRNGENGRLLLDCGPDWCNNPALSPDGSRLAYARRSASVQPGGPPGVPRIWMLVMETGQTAPLYSDQDITGFDPLWSYQGNRLAFFDGANSGIRVLVIDKEDDLLLPSNMGAVGSWSPDGQRMMFIDTEMALERPYVIVYIADFRNEMITPALSSELVRTEYGKPVWSPDGEWIAIGVRPLSGVSMQQIWIMRPDGSGLIEVTDDFLHVHTAYRWNPGGDALVLQRLNLSSSSSTPEVLVWQRDSGQFIRLAEDAGFADWLP
jgi:TolB protein